MRKTIIIAVLAFGMNVTAQTNVTKDASGWSILNGIYRGSGSVAEEGINLSNGGKIVIYDPQGVNVRSEGGVNISGSQLTVSNGLNVSGNTTNNGVLYTGAGGTSLGLKVNGYAEVTQNLYVNADQITYGKQIVQGAIIANGGIAMNGQKITGLADGVNANDAVNKKQLDLKADKVQVAQDIAKAKEESLAYTDTKVKAVNDKLDLEIEANRLAQKRLDDKINSNDEKINQRVRDLEIKIDNRFNAVMSYVGNEFNAVNNRIEGLGASMVALSAAATSSVYNANKPTNLNIATGLYGRATAIAVGMSHFFNSSTKVSVNWSQGSNTKNAVGIGAGFAF